MNLDVFISKHDITLDPKIYDACLRGVEVMSIGIDPHHNAEHISNLLGYLDDLLTSKSSISQSIRYDILLPAICWHDTWVSSRQSHSALTFLRHQIVEGRGSARIWKEYATGRLSESYITAISYCIRKHSSFQLLPTFTTEAKILIDLDKLDLWNIRRFLNKDETFASQKGLYSRLIVQLYYMYSWYAGLHFAELNSKLDLLKNNFWSEIR